MLAIIFTLLVNQAYAQTTGVFCFDESENAHFMLASRTNQYCQTALKEGVACFTGHPHLVVDLLNKQRYFTWDDETIRASHYRGDSDTIEYLYIDFSIPKKTRLVLPHCHSLEN